MDFSNLSAENLQQIASQLSSLPGFEHLKPQGPTQINTAETAAQTDNELLQFFVADLCSKGATLNSQYLVALRILIRQLELGTERTFDDITRDQMLSYFMKSFAGNEDVTIFEFRHNLVTFLGDEVWTDIMEHPHFKEHYPMYQTSAAYDENEMKPTCPLRETFLTMMQLNKKKVWLDKGSVLTENQKLAMSVVKDFRKLVFSFARRIGLLHRETLKAYTANSVTSYEFRYKIIACLFIECFYPDGVIDPIPSVIDLMRHHHGDVDPEKTQTLVRCLTFLNEPDLVEISNAETRQQLDLDGENADVVLLTTSDVNSMIVDTVRSAVDYAQKKR